jgi:AbiV family abortive infection protein
MAQPSVRSLNATEVAQAMEFCLKNIRDLIGDADMLIAAKRSARAYFLLHTAAEELSKFFILEVTGRQIAKGISVNWKRFWQRLRNHASKLAHAELRFLIGSLADRSLPGDIELAGLALLTEHALVPRNASLYVGIDPQGRFRAPTDIEWDAPTQALRATVQRLLTQALKIGSSANVVEASFRRATDPTEAMETFKIAIERIRNMGVTQEELKEILTKLFKKSVRNQT